MLRSTAIETWRATGEAIKTLIASVPGDDHHAESIAANFSIVMLAAGLESYGRRRFSEVEQEGVSPDFGDLAKKLFPAQRRDEILADHRARASAEGRFVSELVAEMTDMGNYDRLKSSIRGRVRNPVRRRPRPEFASPPTRPGHPPLPQPHSPRLTARSRVGREELPCQRKGDFGLAASCRSQERCSIRASLEAGGVEATQSKEDSG